MARSQLSPDRTPINAEARGRLRVWKRNAAAKWQAFDRAQRSPQFSAASIEFARKSSKGQARALARMQQLLAGTAARLEGVRYSPSPTVLWTVLRPRGSVIMADPGVEPAKLQDCVTINYFLVHVAVRGVVYRSDGLWTLEVPDHALGRLLQRDRMADLDAVLLDAHHAALRVKVCDAHPALSNPNGSFQLSAGNGVFVCSVRIVPDISLGYETAMHLAAHTWLHGDQLQDSQTALSIDGDGDERLGDALLLPAPLKRFERGEDGTVSVTTWRPGLPETLAKTRGRA